MEYEKRIVCFMDILGFKQLISKSEKDIELRNKILDLLNDVEAVHSEFCYKRKVTVSPESCVDSRFTTLNEIDVGVDTEMSIFSDSIIISYKLTQQRSDLMDVIVALNEIGQIAFQLLCRGFFVRGGLVFGDIYHKGNICYGPALVKSVNLESEAIYPIISIDPSFFDEGSINSVYFGKKSLSTNNREYIEDTYHCVNIGEASSDLTLDIWNARKSSEYMHFLDFLDININYDEQVALHIKSIIESELKKDYSEHIAKKYRWIRDYYNSIVCQSQCMENLIIEYGCD